MRPENATRANGHKRRALMVLAGLGVLIYMAAALITDADKLRAALVQLGWMGAGLVLALSGINYLLRFHRWQLYLGKLDRHLPTLRHLLYYLGGFAFTVSPGKAGEAVRAVYLREHGVTYSESIATLFVERLLDLVTMVILASFIMASSPTYRPLLIGVAIAIVLLLIVVSHPFPQQWLLGLSTRHQTGRFGKLLAALASMLRSSQRLLHPQLLLMGLILGLISWGAEGLGFYLVCNGLNLSLSVFDAIGIYALSALAGSAAVFLPGGIGGMELVMTTVLMSRGASLSTAVIATLLCRLATLWFAVVIGLVAATVLELHVTRQRTPASPPSSP